MPGLKLHYKQTRLLFGVGASGITSMLSALLTSMAARNDASHDIVQPLTPASEEQPLLGWRRPAPDTVTGKRPKSPHARLAALLGISTGLGALLAVFFFLRLPTILHSHNDTAGGLRRAFRLVAAVALMNACWAAFTLPQSQATITSAPSFSHSEPQKNKVRRICSGITAELLQLCQGFVLGSRNATIALGFASGFIARAQVITVRCVRLESQTRYQYADMPFLQRVYPTLRSCLLPRTGTLYYQTWRRCENGRSTPSFTQYDPNTLATYRTVTQPMPSRPR